MNTMIPTNPQAAQRRHQNPTTDGRLVAVRILRECIISGYRYSPGQVAYVPRAVLRELLWLFAIDPRDCPRIYGRYTTRR